MSLIKKLTAVAVLAASCASVSAEESKPAPSNPWTECGIGAMIFPKSNAGAVISNVIWDLGTTAVTSAGLSPETCDGVKVAAAVFINETFVNVEEETAIGSGEHLTAALNLAGCESNSHQDVISALQVSYAEELKSDAYASKTTSEKAQAYYGALQDAAVNTGQCAVI